MNNCLNKSNNFRMIPQNSFEISKIGPISPIEDKIFSIYNKSLGNFEAIHNLIETLLFKFRKICGDGNCFYRSVMFAQLETAILERNIQLLKFYILEILDLFKAETLETFTQETETFVLKIDYPTTVLVLMKIIEFLEIEGTNEKKEECLLAAYKLYITAYNTLESFDLVYY